MYSVMHETETSSGDKCKQLSRLHVCYISVSVSLPRRCLWSVRCDNECRLIVRWFQSGKTGILLLLCASLSLFVARLRTENSPFLPTVTCSDKAGNT